MVLDGAGAVLVCCWRQAPNDPSEDNRSSPGGRVGSEAQGGRGPLGSVGSSLGIQFLTFEQCEVGSFLAGLSPSSPGGELCGGLDDPACWKLVCLAGVHSLVTGRTQKSSLVGSQVHSSPRRLFRGRR